MATADKTSRRTKNILSDDNIKKAREGRYYNRVPTGQLKINGAYKFLGLDKAGNPKPSTESIKNPGFFYSPNYRVAGTLAQLQQYTRDLQAASGDRQLFDGGADAYARSVAQDPTNYTTVSVSSTGPLRSQFLAEVSQVEAASKSEGGTSKMSQEEAARYIQQLLALRGTSFKIEKAKGKAKAKAKKAPAKKAKRTGKRKTAAKKPAAKREIPVAAISPRSMTGLPAAAGLGGLPAAAGLGGLSAAAGLGGLSAAAGLGGLVSPPGSPGSPLPSAESLE